MDFTPYVSRLTQQHKLCNLISQTKADIEQLTKDRDMNKQLQQAFRDSMGDEKEVMLVSSKGFLHLPKAHAFGEVVGAQSETLKAIEDAKKALERALHELAMMKPNLEEMDEDILAELQRYASDMT